MFEKMVKHSNISTIEKYCPALDWKICQWQSFYLFKEVLCMPLGQRAVKLLSVKLWGPCNCPADKPKPHACCVWWVIIFYFLQHEVLFLKYCKLNTLKNWLILFCLIRYGNILAILFYCKKLNTWHSDLLVYFQINRAFKICVKVR